MKAHKGGVGFHTTIKLSEGRQGAAVCGEEDSAEEGACERCVEEAYTRDPTMSAAVRCNVR